MAMTEHHAPVLLTPEQLRAPAIVATLRTRWLIVFALAGLGAAAAFLMVRGDSQLTNHFLRAWLIGFMFCAGLTLGSMALMLLYHVVGGKWGLVMLRYFEAGSRNLPLLAAYFSVLTLGVNYLYPWANGQGLTAHGEHALHIRKAYLNPAAWELRAVAFFIAWGVLTFLCQRWARLLDRPFPSDEAYNRNRLRLMRLGGFGVLFYAITISLAAIDWVMSLDAVWYSTIWGMMYMAGQALVTMAFCIIVLVIVSRHEPMRGLLRKSELHDNGKLLLAFVMLYTYLSFSQFIIIWSGNLKEEIPWYIARVRNGWLPIIAGLFAIHFVVPFLLLLNRNLKKQGPRLAAVALWLLFARYVDLYWHIVPNFSDASWPHGSFVLSGFFNARNTPNWMDVVVPFAMIAGWMAAFFGQLARRPILPAYHHLVPEIMEKSHGAH